MLKFYKNLYAKGSYENEKQEYFLSFLTNELSDVDRAMLSSPLSCVEIYGKAGNMATDRTPGGDGLPVEFYNENSDIIAENILALYNTSLQTGY